MVDVQRLKSIELEMLKSFAEICEKLNLRYYLIGGTLLGAVRHRGFIPWDDDIDVGMPREDYEVFLKEAQKYLPEYYFLQTRKTDPEYLSNFAKIRDSRTTFLDKAVKHRKTNHGVYIDVFPIDYYPDTKCKQLIFDFKKFLQKFRLRGAFIIPEEEKHAAHIEFLAKMLSICLMVIYPTTTSVLDAEDRLFKKEKNSSLVANLCGYWGKREILPASLLAETCDVEFEGLYFKGPKEYDKYLTRIYGDYMKLPPVEKRVSHHYCEVIDLDKPYTEYMS